MLSQNENSSALASLRDALWVWCGQARRTYHNVVCFTREITVAESVQSARLLITADARYEVFVNGEWVGQGPPRAWPSHWPVDAYGVAHLLRPGANRIAVIVQHWGLSTFQYLNAAPGLLAAMNWTDEAGEHLVTTDSAWRCRPHDGFAWPVPRISCMQAWEEQFDARQPPAADWMTTGIVNDWPAATEACRAGTGPHSELEWNTLPPLTREPAGPRRVHSIEIVRPAPYTWTLNPRDLLNPTDKSANHVRGRMLLVSHVFSEQSQPISFHQPHHRPHVPCKLNGRPLAFDDSSLHKTDTGVAHAQLRAGWNTLVARLPEVEHYWWMTINAWTEQPVRWSATPDNAHHSWLAIGPFAFEPRPGTVGRAPSDSDPHLVEAAQIDADATAERFHELWERGRFTESELSTPFARPLAADMVATTDVFAISASDRPVANVNAHLRVDNANALLQDTADWTTFHPGPPGEDVRLLLDFGHEVIGHHEFAVDAPAGTILDFHNFEFIQPDGRFNLAEGMNNSSRYVCRAGVQRYRTLIRRGFRYSWITIRDQQGQRVRVRFVRVLASTYPQARQGAFACSDPLLDRIWETGARSVECCSEDTYTDCPTYEQTFWVGDGRNEAMVDLLANGDPRLSAHAWELAARSLGRSPLVESQVPSGWQNVLPAWSFLWMRWAQEHFQLTGDRAFGSRAIEHLDRNVAGIELHLTPHGLFRYRGWNMFDWAEMDTPGNGEITHLNCLAVLGLRQSGELAAAMGEAMIAARWRALADRIAASVNTHLWDELQQAYIDCIHPDGRRSEVFSQQTQTAAFIAGVPTAARQARCWQLMTRPPEGFVTAGSPFFMFFLLEGLARRGEVRALVDTIRGYWGKQIEAGATTFWETYAPDGERMTRSHCHGWSAAPTFFLTQYVLGVRPALPGYEKILVAPQPAGLRWARGRVPTPAGPVECDWTVADDAFELRLSLPPGRSARVEFPFAGRLNVRAGQAITLADSNEGRVGCEVTGQAVLRVAWDDGRSA